MTLIDYAMLGEVRAALGQFDSLELQPMIDNVARRRGEEIVLLEGRLDPAAASACWVRAIEPDGRITNYLITDSSLDDLLFKRTVRHELGHMFFDDPAVGAPEPVDLAPVGLSGTRGTVMRHRGCARDTDDPAELQREARVELFAALAGAHSPQPAPMPDGVRRLLAALEAGA